MGSGYDEEADNGPKTWLEKFKARLFTECQFTLLSTYTNLVMAQIGYQNVSVSDSI